ncbi:hypothetical protein Q5P01_013088 [Channa striata]|uniref:Myb/SANT-like DNA-binding domain-containing protein n=1 Tax=Channa striata TaxID=64152 RepID=A0AA88SNQ6_CHASR|nr:hypothetical protein Q5P01_013088 [Channa striata]
MTNAYRKDNRLMIQLGATNAAIFSGRKHSAMRGWRTIRKEMGLQGILSAQQLKKKWDNMKDIYHHYKNSSERLQRQALEREQSEFDRELVSLERDRELLNRDMAMLEQDRVVVQRDRVLLDQDRAFVDRDRACLDRDRMLLERSRENLERERERDTEVTNQKEVKRPDRDCFCVPEPC